MSHADLRFPLLLALAAVVCAPVAGARSTDRTQPMNVDAGGGDFCLQDDCVSILSDVHIVQGTLDIRAARAEIHKVSGDIQRLVLTGSPVTLSQVGDDGLPTNATAAQITYVLAEERMRLTGNVVLKQPRGDLRGETVTYDINTGHLTGGGDGRRVQMTIQPRRAPAATAPADPAPADPAPAEPAPAPTPVETPATPTDD